ncbi:DUF169 domain-containing protein [Rhizocola hellebori]|nr:DUF169 domain-containing protein [Rhizocola hellebori]
MRHHVIAQRLISALDLGSAPIALTFVDSAPDGLPAAAQPRPSACSFWRDAEHGTFFASAVAHLNCALGAMVMGFDLPAETYRTLGDIVTMMCECSYLDPIEADKVPSMAGPSNGIVYGPLAQHPLPPDLVLMWLSPKQAMLFNEAAGTASWAAGSTAVTGRPACAALPLASADAVPTMSFGCTGMRTFTEVADDHMLSVVPGQRLERFTAAVEGTQKANHAMTRYYQQQKEQLAAVDVER